jgi:hypothetical protein
MDRQAAINAIKEACAALSRDLMKLNPPIGSLGDKPTQDELFETIYRITKDVEIIKKRVIKLEKSEDTPEL